MSTCLGQNIRTDCISIKVTGVVRSVDLLAFPMVFAPPTEWGANCWHLLGVLLGGVLSFGVARHVRCSLDTLTHYSQKYFNFYIFIK